MLQNVTVFTWNVAKSASARISSIKLSRSFNGPKLKFSALCLDLEKYIFCLAKFSPHWKSVLHTLAKTLPRFRKNQKLSQCPSGIVIVIYKSLLPLTGQLWNGKEEIVSFFIYLIANWKSFYLMWKSFYRRILRQSFFNAFFFKGWLSSVRFKYKPGYKPRDL